MWYLDKLNCADHKASRVSLYLGLCSVSAFGTCLIWLQYPFQLPPWFRLCFFLFPFLCWCGWSSPLLPVLGWEQNGRVLSSLGAGVGRSHKCLPKSFSKSGVTDAFWILQPVVCSVPVDMLCGFVPICLFLAISRSLYILPHQKSLMSF